MTEPAGKCYLPRMNSLSRLVVLGLLGGLIVTPAVGQLVHLSFSEPNGYLTFRADHASVSWNLTEGAMTRLDIFYDVEQQKGEVQNRDPSRNFWRAKVETYGIGSFEIVRPIMRLGTAEYEGPPGGTNTLWLNHYDDVGKYEQFEFSLQFTDTDPSELPVPPFVLGHNSFSLEAGRTFFDVPRMGWGYGNAGFNVATAAIVPYPDFRPIPEPATYAWAALALLGAAVVRARWARIIRT